MKVPFLDLKVHDEDTRKKINQALKEILDNAAYIGGKPVQKFAENFAKACGVSQCAPVANGTDALILALRAYGIGPGDEVITTPFTFIATTEAITAVGATIKFVDIDPKTYTIDPVKTEKAITSKTKAILIVHLFGHPCDMDPLLALAKKHNIRLIEDAAQAHGARYKKKLIGSFGDAACFSFYPTKNLGAMGDAGAVVSDDKDFIDRLLQLANHGRSAQYFHAVEGVNSRMDGMQAAILDIFLEKLEEMNNRRRSIAKSYSDVLKNHSKISPPFVSPDAEPVFHLYCLHSSERDRLSKYLTEKEIGNGVYYPLPLHLQPAYSRLGLKEGDFPASERASKTILSLPLYPNLENSKVDYILQALKEFN